MLNLKLFAAIVITSTVGLLGAPNIAHAGDHNPHPYTPPVHEPEPDYSDHHQEPKPVHKPKYQKYYKVIKVIKVYKYKPYHKVKVKDKCEAHPKPKSCYDDSYHAPKPKHKQYSNYGHH